jgi:hypothetical protein
MEEVSSKLKCKKVTMCTSFFMIVTTLLTLITFTSMINVGEVEAATVVSPNCGVIDQSPSGECSVSIDYDGNCSPSSSSCNIAVNINKNPGGGSINFVPNGNNELKLHSVLETGVECSDVKSSWGKANCLLNSKNNYVSNTIIDTDGLATLFDNEVNYEGSQQVRDTSGQDNFKATNTMNQKAVLSSRGAGATLDTDGDGKNVILKYTQDIVKPDDTQNTNLGAQAINTFVQDKSKIDTSNHEELGFNLLQTLRNNDDDDGTHISSPITTKNEANQVLNMDARSGATIKYDTLGLSTTTQDIYKCSFGGGSCTNTAGTIALPQSGMRTELTATGAGTLIEVDDLQQLLTQKIQYFKPSINKAASNTANTQVVSAVAQQGGKIDLNTGDSSSQKITQTITGTDSSPLKGNVQNVAVQTLDVGVAGISVLGTVEASVDQSLQQSITGSRTDGSSNNGQTLVTLLSKEGPSQLFINGFDQYLTQTVSNCIGCSTNGIVTALFEVEDAATFTLRDGSIQGLTQTVNQDGAAATNTVSSRISVLGDGTDANIGLNQQLTNINGANNGNSNFQATYSADANQQCNISTVGTFTPGTSCS